MGPCRPTPWSPWVYYDWGRNRPELFCLVFSSSIGWITRLSSLPCYCSLYHRIGQLPSLGTTWVFWGFFWRAFFTRRLYKSMLISASISKIQIKWDTHLVLRGVKWKHQSISVFETESCIRIPGPTLRSRMYIILSYPPFFCDWECNAALSLQWWSLLANVKTQRLPPDVFLNEHCIFITDGLMQEYLFILPRKHDTR